MEAGKHFQRKLVKIIFFPLLDFGFVLDSFHGQEFSSLLGLLRCGKSCRLRWTNYLRPDIKRGPFTPEEEKLVVQLHAILGNRLLLHCLDIYI